MSIWAMAMKKLLEMVPTLAGITLFSFLFIRIIPGDPVLLMVGERGADPQQYEAMQKQLGLDRPLYEQYGLMLANIARGDLGHSLTSHRPVKEEFLARWPATLELGLAATLLSLVVGIPLGICAALKKNSAVDYVLMGGSLIGYSMPIFWWGIILILVFSIQLGWTPVSGRLDVAYFLESGSGFLLIDTLSREVREEYGLDAFVSALSHLILPALTMATIPIAVYARMTRASMLEVLNEDYIRTARSIGLSRFQVIFKHALRNALIPLITVGGLLLISTAITGAILTETIFSWPGIGNYIVSSVNARDYPVIQGAILSIGTAIVGINLLVELCYRWANPRLRG